MFFSNYGGLNRNAINMLFLILIIWSFISMGVSGWIQILMLIPAIVIGISLHEYAHARAADKLGDTTPRIQGRLTLNPLKHLDFFGTLLIFGCNFGWGKPVQINPDNFVNTNRSKGFCEVMVALAGPLMNFFVAIIMAFVITLIKTFEIPFFNTQAGVILYQILVNILMINVGLGVFNLIPLPPLDGDKIFKNLLPYRVRSFLDRNTYTIQVMFLILYFFGVLSYITAPIIEVLSTLIVRLANYVVYGILWVIYRITG